MSGEQISENAGGTASATAVEAASKPQDWPLRPWIASGLLALAGLLVYLFSHNGDDVPWRMAATAFCVFASVAFALTLERDELVPSAIFAGIVGLVMAGIAWRATAAGDRYSDEQFWVAAGVFAVVLSVPLFQAGFHRLRWKTPYVDTHYHVWNDAICGAGALAFTGLSWLLLALLSELFQVIQIDILRDLMNKEWFGWIFSGAAFGAALGVLRNQLKIIGTLQSVVLLVLSILAVPLTIALLFFLLAVALSGIDVLWEATRSATPLLLAIAVGCFILANAVVRDRDEEASKSRILRLAGFALALGILPLSVMAALSMGTRIAQHGLSPERLWALIAIAVAVAYGVAYFVSAIRGRRDGWRGFLRQSNLHLAVLTCAIALLLAMPLFDFGALSTRDQIARLESGEVSAEDFDYYALRWDFGESGRAALAKLAKSKNPEIAKLAGEASKSPDRYWRRGANHAEIRKKTITEVKTEGVADAVERFVRDKPYLCSDGCRIVEIGEAREAPLLAMTSKSFGDPKLLTYDAAKDEVSEWDIRLGVLMPNAAREIGQIRDNATIEIRPFTGRQLYIDGKPASAPFADGAE